MDQLQTIISRLYKDNSSRLLSVLVRVLGPYNFDIAEDVLQEAFNKALVHWEKSGVPENPYAWLVQTAKRQAIDIIRAHRTTRKFATDLSHHIESEWSMARTVEREFEDHRIQDDQLRLIFMCCRADVTIENRIPFILKVLCGLSIPAIARALVIPEATVKKRLLRTREKFRNSQFERPGDAELVPAMDTVHTVVYLLFNEGFCSTDKKRASKAELCQEAIALVRLLIEDLKMANVETFSLFALMHFHIARLDARFDSDGGLVPIDLQDRSLWKQEYIYTARSILRMIDKDEAGRRGRFYFEAKIAFEHCRAKEFEGTDWSEIIRCYDKLVELTGSPVIELNQAVAVGYGGDVEKAQKKVETLLQHKSLQRSHVPYATLSHLCAMAGDEAKAMEYATQSKTMGGAPYEHRMMMQQIERLLKNNK